MKRPISRREIKLRLKNLFKEEIKRREKAAPEIDPFSRPDLTANLDASKPLIQQYEALAEQDPKILEWLVKNIYQSEAQMSMWDHTPTPSTRTKETVYSEP